MMVEKYMRIALLGVFFQCICSNPYLHAQTADARMDHFDINYYFFNLEVSPANSDIRGNVEVHVNFISENPDTLVLELTDQATVDSIWLNDEPTVFVHSGDLVKIPLEQAFGIDDSARVNFFYAAHGRNFDINEGISNYSDSEGRSVTWTLSEPFYSKNWFPCKQVLEDKIDSARLHFTCSDNFRVGSNGKLQDIVRLDSNKLRYEWMTAYPTAYYLFSFAVAEYMEYSFYAPTGEGDSVLVQNYIYNDSAYLERNRTDIDATGDLITLFSNLLGPYPFRKEKYGHCLAPIQGGMEHQTMTTLSDFRFNLVSHELAHQWFGDHVTCSSWQDIWINEGFASYFELIAIEFLRSKPEYVSWLTESLMLITSRPAGSVYVPESEINSDSRIFDHRLSYEKGAYLLHMLRYEIADDTLFFEALRNYLTEYAGKVATAEDFRISVENTTGMDFSAFFAQWYYGEGYPNLDILWSQKGDTLALTIEQFPTAPESTPFFDITFDLQLNFFGGDTLIRVNPASNKAEIRIPIRHRVYQITPDPEKWMLAIFNSITRVFQEDSTANFAVFPNPLQDEFIIENYQIGLPFHAKLFTNHGVLIDEMEGIAAFTSFNTSNLKMGLYLLAITRESTREVHQIMKY
ncbi:MAG: hypothetical protein JW801_13750 [Bacteroidales bacterium]|nr:hypothetical protein [Bacteroidales bacterium]